MARGRRRPAAVRGAARREALPRPERVARRGDGPIRRRGRRARGRRPRARARARAHPGGPGCRRYDQKTKWFKVLYDDGDEEEVTATELEAIVVGGSEADSEAGSDAPPQPRGSTAPLTVDDKVAPPATPDSMHVTFASLAPPSAVSDAETLAPESKLVGSAEALAMLGVVVDVAGAAHGFVVAYAG